MTIPPRIQPGSRVLLHLSIRLLNGTEALSTFGDAPLDLILGDGTLTPATEAMLLGLSAGDECQRLVHGDDLFGTWSGENLYWLARADFPTEVPQPGSLVAFTTAEGSETGGIVREIEEQRVRVDFNHPLSGRVLDLHFKILVVAS